VGSKDRSTTYLWLDTEYTTLDLQSARLLQVALVITDYQLKRLTPDRGLNLYVGLPEGAEDEIGEWVRTQIPQVVEASKTRGLPVAEIDDQLTEYTDHLLGRPAREQKYRPTLAGNSIHCDWVLVTKYLPQFAQRLNYRLLDVTMLKLQWKHFWSRREFDKSNRELIRRYYPDADLELLAGEHDAYYDVQASIAELAYYRSKLNTVR